MYGFLLVSITKFVPVRRKSPMCPTTVYLATPLKGFPLKLGIVERGNKSLNDGATRWWKKFQDRFSRLDTIPAVTDSHPDIHVAVAYTSLCYESRGKKAKTAKYITTCKVDYRSTQNIL